ncbi:hypothetical protein BRARA_C01485 [Brassica rapa]|uniref:Uncharacterized protein n=1 Tax=Brassica campestris TaxID=3711 RepID=A0A397ZUX1_BRACM|nr:hypothetical protein BRARA_C01485 [Brassica rapa]
MRYNVMFMVSCVLTFLVLNNAKGRSDKKIGCKVVKNFQGTCGNNGKSACVNDFKKFLRLPNNIGIRCDCSDRPNYPGITSESN